MVDAGIAGALVGSLPGRCAGQLEMATLGSVHCLFHLGRSHLHLLQGHSHHTLVPDTVWTAMIVSLHHWALTYFISYVNSVVIRPPGGGGGVGGGGGIIYGNVGADGHERRGERIQNDLDMSVWGMKHTGSSCETQS